MYIFLRFLIAQGQTDDALNLLNRLLDVANHGGRTRGHNVNIGVNCCELGLI